ncbi:MAG: septal ring lytic transglycosylase RlpA family protein [Hyphomonadaceae bacterium]|nr:septal ring lytic transglycosylase RlpA family protein [Hyphomonadaceae bacterium]
MGRLTAMAACSLLLGSMTLEAAAEPGRGAPITFARSSAQGAAPASPVGAAPRFQVASAAPRTLADAAHHPESLYGYGASRSRGAPPIDLRGALAGAEPQAVLADDAFEAAPGEPPRSVTSLPERQVAAQPVSAANDAVPAMQGAAARPMWLAEEKTGAPYQAHGQWYVPTAEPGYAETGAASWYGAEFHGRPTASGEIFDAEALTAAHPTLPIPSLVQVTNLENGREVVVRVNDRGPFHGGRLIDVSRKTAEVLGFEAQGQARVHVRYLGPAPRRVNGEGADVPAKVVPAVAPPPPQTSAAPDAGAIKSGAYFVQAGAFSNPVNAERARAVLGEAGPVSVDRREANGAVLHRVRVGAFPSRAEAEAVRQHVASLGYPASVVPNRDAP